MCADLHKSNLKRKKKIKLMPSKKMLNFLHQRDKFFKLRKLNA